MNACGAVGERIRKSLAKKLPGREAWALGDQAVVSGTNFLTNALCVNNSETSLPSTITVGAEKDSHLHEQDQW